MQTILVVEDNEQVRAMAVRTLRTEGYYVLEARDGLAALHVLRATPEIHLIITDVVMPGLGGFELASHVAAAYNTPILFISGYTHDPDEVPGPILQKPFSSMMLADVVRQLLTVSGGDSPVTQ